MTLVRSNFYSFNGGEVTPEFFGQITDAKYQTGLALARNMVCTPQGPAQNRAGFAFVREAKDSSRRVRLLSFTYSTNQTMIVELGAGYFRFHTRGATLMNGAVPYEITNTYSENDLFDIHYVQSGDVMTLVHPNYPPAELRRLGALSWQWVPISFTPAVGTPTNVTATPTGSTPVYDYYYVITALAADGVSESPPSAAATCGNNLFVTGAKNAITWDPVTGVNSYLVYKATGGQFGFIGRSDGSTTFTDDNIAPDLSRTPPNYETVFQSTGNYPAAVSYFEQRRAFAGTLNAPSTIWMTRSGTESDMSYSIPTRDDDRIKFRVAALESNTIRHIVPLNNLVLLTSSAEWRVSPINSDAITPTTISVRPQSYIGASNIRPALINNNLLYGAARGGHMREMAYSWQANGYQSGDLSLRATHLFDGYTLLDMCYSKAPSPIVWAVSSTGKLLGITYVPEQQVGAWHQHDTDGVFESCAVVAEDDEDVLYVIVRRQVNGLQKRYVERQASRRVTTAANYFFVDSGATYSGAPTSTISNLTWLEGKTVSILADGAVHPQRTVLDGQIQLDRPATMVTVGLPYQSDIKTLPLATMADSAYGQGRKKNVNKVFIRVKDSSGVKAGPNEADLVEFKQRTTEPYGTPPTPVSGVMEIDVKPSWGDDAQILVRQDYPLPMMVVAMAMETSLGN